MNTQIPRRALVVGATGDLGPATSRYLRKSGYDLYLHAHVNRERLELLSVELEPKATFLADVRDEYAVGEMFERIGALDCLVYCAAVNPIVETISTTPLETWRDILDVNLTGAFTVLKASLDSLRNGELPAVVLVSSVFGLQTPARRAAYGASKHGLTALVQAATKEEGGWLRINEVCPGPMWGDNLRYIFEQHASAAHMTLEEYMLTRLGDVPAGRFMELAECASVVEFLCSKGSSFLRGESIRITGGASQ